MHFLAGSTYAPSFNKEYSRAKASETERNHMRCSKSSSKSAVRTLRNERVSFIA